MSYLQFLDDGTSSTGKTKKWNVINTDSQLLGKISWYGPFRKYAYIPGFSAVYDEACLREIADFIEVETKKHKSFDPTQLQLPE